MNPFLNRFLMVGAIILLSGMTVACSHGRGVQADDIVATWSGGTVTHPELQGWLDFRGEDLEEIDLVAAASDMLLVETLADSALEEGIGPATEEAVGKAVNRILKAQLRRHSAAHIEVDEEEIDAAVARHPDAFKKPRKLRLRNLFLRYPSHATADEKQAVRTRMSDLERQILDGADFGAVAERYSDSQTRFRKGLMGNVAAGVLPAEIDAIAMALEPGAISSVIESAEGLTLLKCDRVIAAHTPTAAELREKFEANIRLMRARESWERLERSLEQQADRGDLLSAAAGRARELGLDQDPDVANRIFWTRRQNLATEGLRRRVEARLVLPDEAQIRAYVEEHRGDFVTPETFDLSAIRLDVGDRDMPTIYDQASALSMDIRAGRRDFAAAARLLSNAPSAEEGGRLGPMTRREIGAHGPEFTKTVLSLEVGGTSREFVDGNSIWILRLDARHPARPMDNTDACEIAKNRLTNAKAEVIQECVEDEIRSTLRVQFAK